ncbi:PAS domain S-box protein [Candidatus Woesearchaeota archaeon]|nr:PAS domain S-box protein [Candidatus Woesearchaeota archaeon]
MKVKIKNIILGVFILLALVGSLGGTYYYYNISNDILIEQVSSHLETTLSSRASHIQDILKATRDHVKICSARTLFRENLFNINRGIDSEGSKARIQKSLDDMGALANTFYEALVIDKKGIVVSASPKDSIGSYLEGEDFFIQCMEGYPYISDAHIHSNVKVIGFAHPVIDTSSGEIEGVFLIHQAFESSLNAAEGLEFGIGINSVTEDRTGLGDTGEIYLVNKEGYMITPSRFLSEEETFLSLKVDSVNLMGCFGEVDGIASTAEEYHPLDEPHNPKLYPDYMGNEVLGTHIHISEIGWCLLAEIHEEEALGIARKRLIRAGILVAITIILIVAFIGFVISKNISGPIESLTNDVDSITKGNLDIRLGKSSISEIDRLIGSLNRILASMKLAILRAGVRREDIGIGEAIAEKELAEERYKALFEKAADAVLIADPKTRKLVDANKSAESLLGIPKDKIISMKVDQIHPKDRLKETLEGFKKQAAGKIKKLRTEVLTKDNKRIPVEISASPIRIKGKDYVQGIFREMRKNGAK